MAVAAIGYPHPPLHADMHHHRHPTHHAGPSRRPYPFPCSPSPPPTSSATSATHAAHVKRTSLMDIEPARPAAGPHPLALATPVQSPFLGNPARPEADNQTSGSNAPYAAATTATTTTPVVNPLAEIMSSILTYIWFSPSKSASDEPTPPSVLMRQFRPSEDFQKFVHLVLTTTQVSTSVVLLALYFVYRLKNENSITGARGSEYRLAVTALMLANKMLDDHTYTAKTWSEVSGIALEPIKAGELEFLKGLDFNLHMDGSTFAGWERFIHGIASAKNAPPKRRRRTNFRSTDTSPHHQHQQQKQEEERNKQVVLPPIRMPEQTVPQQMEQESRVYAPLPSISRGRSTSPTTSLNHQPAHLSSSHPYPPPPPFESPMHPQSQPCRSHPPPPRPPPSHPSHSHQLYPPAAASTGYEAWNPSAKRGSVDVFAADDGQRHPKRFASTSSLRGMAQHTPAASPAASQQSHNYPFMIPFPLSASTAEVERPRVSPAAPRSASRYASMPGSSSRHRYSLRSGSSTHAPPPPPAAASTSSVLTPPPSSSISPIDSRPSPSSSSLGPHHRLPNLVSFTHLCDSYSPVAVRQPSHLANSNLMFYSLAAGQAKGIVNYHQPGPVPVVETPRYPTQTVTPLRAGMTTTYWHSGSHGGPPQARPGDQALYANQEQYAGPPAPSQGSSGPFYYSAPFNPPTSTSAPAPYWPEAQSQPSSRPNTSGGYGFPSSGSTSGPLLRTPAQTHSDLPALPHSVHSYQPPAHLVPTSPYDYALARRSSHNDAWARRPSSSSLRPPPPSMPVEPAPYARTHSVAAPNRYQYQSHAPSPLHYGYAATDGETAQAGEGRRSQPPAAYSNYSNAGVPGVYGLGREAAGGRNGSGRGRGVEGQQGLETRKMEGWREDWSWQGQGQARQEPGGGVAAGGGAEDQRMEDGVAAYGNRTTLTPTFAQFHPGR